MALICLLIDLLTIVSTRDDTSFPFCHRGLRSKFRGSIASEITNEAFAQQFLRNHFGFFPPKQCSNLLSSLAIADGQQDNQYH